MGAGSPRHGSRPGHTGADERSTLSVRAPRFTDGDDPIDTSQYEIRCHRCDVSFPIGDKKCLHCGGQLGASVTPDFAQPGLILRPEPLGEAEEEKAASGGFLRRGMGGMWIVVVVLISLYRACAGG